VPEISTDATLLIATSWQALGRAQSGDEKSMICNCTVIIVFAAFYLEANLTQIIESVNKYDDLINFADNDRPGLGVKFAFLYKELMLDDTEIDKKKIYLKIKEEFPEAVELYDFRNKVAHGEIDRSLATLENAKRLRFAAKKIVSRFLDTAKNAGYEIDRGTTYEFAISSTEISEGAGAS
jgi:hypothetical protein